MNRSHSPITVLGFDFGLKRIGVAVGQTMTQTARPLIILNANRGVPNWNDIQKLIDEWAVDALVVGLPLNMDGTEQAITQQARAFAKTLENKFHLPLYFSDERLTTIAAKDELHSQKSKKRFSAVDSVSAKLIVESWMDTDIT